VGTKLTSLGIAVLALLRERPMHPYEMYQLLLERREDFLVKVRPGSLYHTVDRLAEHELVKVVGTERDGGRPERTTYCITPAGVDRLSDAIREVLRTPVNEYPQFPIALSEAHNLPREEVIGLLNERVAQLDGTLAETGRVLKEARDRDVAEAYVLAGHYIRGVHKTEVRMLRRLIKRLETGDLAWPYDDAGGCAPAPADPLPTNRLHRTEKN